MTGRRGAVLLADIGGTNARFALMHNGVVGPITQIKVADHPDPIATIRDVLQAHPIGASASAAVFGIAGIVDRDRCTVTNSGWLIDAASLRSGLGLRTVHLLNDFEALAWSVSHLAPADVTTIHAGQAVATAPKVLIGPGTGFGTSCLLKGTDGTIVFASEAGHSTLAAASRREEQVIDRLRQRFGHASIERALSGPGLENLYEALSTIDRSSGPSRTAAEITKAALERQCATSAAALEMFCALLGTVAGNLALTFCARGGVYIGGGVVPHFTDYLIQSEFCARFEAKGRFRSYLQTIPVNVITRPDATFIGLTSVASSLGLTKSLARSEQPPASVRHASAPEAS